VIRDIRLSDYLQLLRRQRWVIAFATLATMTLGILLASSQPEVYSSTASVRLSPDASVGVFDTEQPDDTERSRELLTEVEVLTSGSLRQLVTARLGSDPPRFSSVSARLVGFSEIIEISVKASSPVDAATVANAFADVFIEQRRERAVGELTDQINGLRAQAAEGSAQVQEIDARLADPAIDPSVADGLEANREVVLEQLQLYTTRADQLEIIANLREGNTERVTTATINPQPIAPRVGQNAVAGIVLGLLGGLGIAVVRDLVRDRLSDPDEITMVDPEAPVLAAVPHMRSRASDGSLVASPAADEAYRYLRTALQFAALDGSLKVIAVTSALSGEGKSTTALNLARAAAASGRRVAIIDCDLRRPSLHTSLGIDASPGVVSVVLGEANLGDVVAYPAPNIAAVAAGSPTGSATGILGSERFARLVRAISEQADLTLLDLPPVLPVADPLAVAGVVDGVVLVARVGQVRRKELAATIRRVRDLDVPVLGVVVNDVIFPSATYGGYSPYVEPGRSGRRWRRRQRRSSEPADESSEINPVPG
jgi:capsular exopolysaccharide synthesis family protein